MEHYEIVKKVILTEKTTVAKDEANKYVFEVDPRANKIEITRPSKSFQSEGSGSQCHEYRGKTQAHG
jgi:large subunit ribosomal protein L23